MKGVIILEKKFKLALVISMIVLGLSACGAKEVSDQGKEIKKENGRTLIGNMYEEGLPIVKEKETFTVLVQKPVFLDSFSNMPIYQDLEEKTNIHIEWQEIPADGFTEKVNVMFASGTFPDMMMHTLSNAQILNYSSAGDIIALNDLIDKYAPNWKNTFENFERAKRIATAPDGNIYSLPAIRLEEWEHGMRDAMFINQDWLDKVNKSVPTNLNELIDVLREFKGKDLNGNGVNDEVPFSFVYGATISGQYDIMSSFGILDSSNHLYIDGNKVKSALFHSNYKNAINFLHRMYKEGLIDPESFTQTSVQHRAKVSANPAQVGFFSAYSDGSSESNNYTVVPPMYGPNGERPLMRTQLTDVVNGKFTIFKNNKSPEVAMRWANELATEEYGLRAIYDPIQKNNDGTYTKLEDPERDATGLTKAPTTMSPYVLMETAFEKFTNLPNGERRDLYELYKPFVAKKEDMFPSNMFYTDEQNQVISTYWTDILTYVNKEQAKWITEGGIDKDWDEFVSTLQSMKFDVVMAAHQEAYDTFIRYDKEM